MRSAAIRRVAPVSRREFSGRRARSDISVPGGQSAVPGSGCDGPVEAFECGWQEFGAVLFSSGAPRPVRSRMRRALMSGCRERRLWKMLAGRTIRPRRCGRSSRRIPESSGRACGTPSRLDNRLGHGLVRGTSVEEELAGSRIEDQVWEVLVLRHAGEEPSAYASPRQWQARCYGARLGSGTAPSGSSRRRDRATGCGGKVVGSGRCGHVTACGRVPGRWGPPRASCGAGEHHRAVRSPCCAGPPRRSSGEAIPPRRCPAGRWPRAWWWSAGRFSSVRTLRTSADFATGLSVDCASCQDTPSSGPSKSWPRLQGTYWSGNHSWAIDRWRSSELCPPLVPLR
ncbi:hypothetical protein SBADM41S_01803 [Streptomyces badius]